MSNPNTPFVTYEPGVPLPEKVCKKCEGRGENRFGPPEMSGREHHNPCVICHGTGKAPLRVLVEEGDWPPAPIQHHAVYKLVCHTCIEDWMNNSYHRNKTLPNYAWGLRIRTQADVAHIADLVRLPGGRWLLVEPEEWLDLEVHLAGIGWVVVRPRKRTYDATFADLVLAGDAEQMQSIVNDCHKLGVPVYCQELGVREEVKHE